MSVVQPMMMSGLEVWPLVEGGKGVAVSNGRSAGHWAAAGGVGTFSGVNPDVVDEHGEYVPLVFRGRDRKERHEELIAYSIQGGISQARLAHEARAGEGSGEEEDDRRGASSHRPCVRRRHPIRPLGRAPRTRARKQTA